MVRAADNPARESEARYMKGLVAAIVIAIGLIVLAQTIFIVTEKEQALVLQFGKFVRTVKEPGLNIKYPFIQDVIKFDRRVLSADASPATYITLDKKRLVVDTVSRWKIVDPLVFFRTVKSYRGAIARLNDVIFSQLREGVANEVFMEFIREKREEIMERVSKNAKKVAERFGIDVIDVRIKRVDLPDEVEASVFARMRAERQRIAKRYRAEGDERARKIRANADKERQIIIAEAYKEAESTRGAGDAQAIKVYADAYGQDPTFYSFFRHLEAYERVFSQDSTLLLEADSDLLKYLNSPKGEKE
jgi:membrane protease subunit HflC